MALIEIDNISKLYGKVEAVAPTDLVIEENEFFALLGPSGCGKTTLLRMMAGFETPTTGRIRIGGEDITDLPPNKRPVNMVFQSYAVFPHMSVEKNVRYGLKVAGVGRRERRLRAAEALEQVGLTEQARRRPDQISGGQRQRVALARALVKRPKVMLLDEPLSALDAKLREGLQIELANLQIDVGITFVMVTHDQDEALSMADRIAVMSAGRIEQLGTPAAIYEAPVSRFVADFIGRVNQIPARIDGRAQGGTRITSALGSVALEREGLPQAGEVTLAVRPEKIRIAPRGTELPGDMRCAGVIRNWAYYGDTSRMIVALEDGMTLSALFQNETRARVHGLDIGDPVSLSWDLADMLVLAR